MQPSTPLATSTPRRIVFALLTVAAFATAGTFVRGRIQHARVVRLDPRTPVQPSGMPVYLHSIRVFERRIDPEMGVVRDLHIALGAAWRRVNDSWVPQPSAHGAIVVPAGRSGDLTDLVGPGFADGDYAVQVTINGRPECVRFALPGLPVACGTNFLMMREGAPRERLPAECRGEGFVTEMRPANGTGIVTRFLEDSRIREQVPLRDGREDGVAMEYYRLSDGSRTHFERTYSRGDLILSRFFDPSGRQVNELPYAHGRPHGTYRAWNEAGALTEETVWNHGAVVSMRSLDGHGQLLASVDYGMPGRDHGTFCRPDHQCSQW